MSFAENKCSLCGKFRPHNSLRLMQAEGDEQWLECKLCMSKSDLQTYFPDDYKYEEKIKELEAKLSIAVEALEFYAEFSNWYGEIKHRGNNQFTDFSRTDLEQFEGHSICGKKARQALKLFNERVEHE